MNGVEFEDMGTTSLEVCEEPGQQMLHFELLRGPEWVAVDVADVEARVIFGDSLEGRTVTIDLPQAVLEQAHQSASGR